MAKAGKTRSTRAARGAGHDARRSSGRTNVVASQESGAHDHGHDVFGALPSRDPRGLGEALLRGHPTTRAHAADSLQRSVGNAHVQRLVADRSVQRDPVPTAGVNAPQPTTVGPTTTAPTTAGPAGSTSATKAPTAAATTWLRPFPTGPIRIDTSRYPNNFTTLASATTGHPYIGTLPTPTADEQATVAHANDYFASSPLEPWERASDAGDGYVHERNKLTDLFQRKAYELTLYTLVQSEQQANSEHYRYDDTNGANPDAEQLQTAAAHLAEAQESVLSLLNVQQHMMEQGPVADTHNMEEFLDDPKLEKVPQAGQPGGDDQYAELTRSAIEQFPGAVTKYRALRDVYGQRFPVLMGANQDYYALANAGPAGLAKFTQGQALQVERNIQTAREELSPAKIWSLPIIISQTKELLGIEEGTGANDAVEGKLSDIGMDSAFHKLAMAALQIGLQIVAATLTGGASLAVQAVGIGIGIGGVADELGEHRFQKAMSSRTALDSAQRLSTDDPGYFWLAVSIASTVLDIGAAGLTFKGIVTPLKAANALGDATKAVKALGTGEGAMQQTATALADVEEIVRAQAQVLKQEGKLAEGMTEELFVQRIMSGLRREVATQGKLAEEQADVVAKVLAGTHPQFAALKAGDRSALVALLTEHGDWKSLVMTLERGGQKEIAEGLVRERALVIDEIAAEVKGLSKEKVPATVEPMKGGSTELVSDVDLQISGGDAGQMMIEAEGYMARRFGDSWSSMFRMNFYTEGSRLTRYQEVLGGLSKLERGAMTSRITSQVERLTVAKMLSHAGSDPAALARVEALAKGIGVDIEELRPLAAMDDAAKTVARNQLLQDIDMLQAEYATAKGARRAELAEQISSKQMEANFYTNEANIGPGSLKLSGFKDLAAAESYQGALTQLEMIAHILAEAGGDVGRASREYELFKYIGRFGDVAEAAGKDSAAMRFLRNQAKAVSGGNREMMEETAHEFLDASKARTSGPRHTDLPQDVGATPPVTDEYLNKSYEIFRDEAAKTLERLNPDAGKGAAAGR